MPGTPRIALAVAFAAAALTLAACGGDDETTTATTTTSTTSTTTEPSASAADCEEVANIDVATGEFTGLEPDCREGTPPPAPASTDLDLAGAAEAAGCELELDLPDEGNTHIPPSKTPQYDTDPPTSGDHDAVPLADGAYLDPPDERHTVHSMEHGRVVIHYAPSLPEEDQLTLKGLVDEDPDGMILIPNPDMPYEVAATAWTNLLGCDSYGPETIDVIRLFRDDFRGEGPEEIPL